MNKADLFKTLCNEISSMYERKNNDYGDSCHKTYEKLGMVSYAVMLNHKLNRFESLCVFNKEQKVNDESAKDTLLDMASYCIQAAMELVNEQKR